MTALEKTYALFSPAPGGGEKERGEVRAVISRLTAVEASDGDAAALSESYIACVLRENAPECGFTRGMRLCRGKRAFRVDSAVEASRLWVLRLSRTVMDGEA